MLCVYCNSEVDNNSEFCNYCGKRLSGNLICPSCSSSMFSGSKFCNKCGECLQPTIYFSLNYNGDCLSMGCNMKAFFYEIFDLLNKADKRYTKVFDKVRETESGCFVMCKFISKHQDKQDAFHYLRNHLLTKGFKHEILPGNYDSVDNRYVK